VKVTVLAGGVGAARFLKGLISVMDQREITVIANTGDDVELHGLHISPDIDTLVYTLADAIDPERGWGLANETWQAMEMVKRYGGIGWFNLGDQDLGTHMFRTQRRSEGASLDVVTAEIARAWGLDLAILPVTNDLLRTMVTVVDEGEITFQEYFVRRQHNVEVSNIRFNGARAATPGPGVIDAIDHADLVVIAPSNPLVSIGPLLAVPGVREAVVAKRAQTVAVSPIVGGAALKGPADRMMRELGHPSTVGGVAQLYHELAATLVIDSVDEPLANEVEAAGMAALAVPTVMSEPGVAAALATAILALVP